MRKIKFRGKRIDNGEWVQGYFFASQMSGAFILLSRIEARKNKSGMSMKDKLEQYEVDPATVGQYTGLKDKDGVEIYEGDIVSGRDSLQEGFLVTGVVDYENGSFIIKSDLAIHYRWLEVEMYFYELKVIGNSHENPELSEYEKEA
jgi:uncharacterized phage protein (TIGR01671 family)